MIHKECLNILIVSSIEIHSAFIQNNAFFQIHNQIKQHRNEFFPRLRKFFLKLLVEDKKIGKEFRKISHETTRTREKLQFLSNNGRKQRAYISELLTREQEWFRMMTRRTVNSRSWIARENNVVSG